MTLINFHKFQYSRTANDDLKAPLDVHIELVAYVKYMVTDVNSFLVCSSGGPSLKWKIYKLAIRILSRTLSG